MKTIAIAALNIFCLSILGQTSIAYARGSSGATASVVILAHEKRVRRAEQNQLLDAKPVPRVCNIETFLISGLGGVAGKYVMPHYTQHVNCEDVYPTDLNP